MAVRIHARAIVLLVVAITEQPVQVTAQMAHLVPVVKAVQGKTKADVLITDQTAHASKTLVHRKANAPIVNKKRPKNAQTVKLK